MRSGWVGLGMGLGPGVSVGAGPAHIPGANHLPSLDSVGVGSIGALPTGGTKMST
jgi:hypothetical protein